jgi:hypothetical protein
VREVVAEQFADARELLGEPVRRRPPPPDDRLARAHWYAAVRLGVGPDGRPFAAHVAGDRIRVCRGDHAPADLPEAEGLVQPLGADRWLVVRSRARRDEENARVYDGSGRLVSSFPVGDAVAHVQTTLDGRIWVGYFDEGVLAARTLAGDGAVCLDEAGRRLFGFNTEGLGQLAADRPPVPAAAVERARARGDRSPVDHLAIHDVYAMNVEPRRRAWLHHYSAFPLVWVEREAVRAIWTELPVVSAHAFAVDGRRVLFAGGRRRRPERPLLTDADYSALGEQIRADAEAARHSFLLVDPDMGAAEPLRPVTREGVELDTFAAFGRGADLFLRHSDLLYRLDLRAL